MNWRIDLELAVIYSFEPNGSPLSHSIFRKSMFTTTNPNHTTLSDSGNYKGISNLIPWYHQFFNVAELLGGFWVFHKWCGGSSEPFNAVLSSNMHENWDKASLKLSKILSLTSFMNAPFQRRDKKILCKFNHVYSSLSAQRWQKSEFFKITTSIFFLFLESCAYH